MTILAVVLAACSSRAEPFQGTELTNRSPATPFELRDQLGSTVRLADFDGKVVLLTFLYTNCPDVCPITTSQLRDARDLLGGDAEDVAFVAISVDPARDSVEAARAYSDKWGMSDRWSYLVGEKDELAPVWKAYYIDPAIVRRTVDSSQVQPQSIAPTGAVSALGQDILERYQVIHSSPVYLIDREGRMRVVFTLPFEPQALVHDVRLLLE